MEDKFSENRTRKQKEKKAGEAEEQAVTDRAVDGSCDRAVLMQRLGFRDRGQQHNAMEPVSAVGNRMKGSDMPVRIPYSLRAEAVLRPNMRSLSGMAMASMLCRKFWMMRPAERGSAIINSSGKRAVT